MAGGHFHILLRTGPSASADASGCRAGPTPLSKVMRRLMTGHAVTFNKRHKRSGHLFQNRYKSVICEEDPYLLELIRYIHLNPLRAKLVEDLKELDKYPWTGHSAILGRRKNLLIPDQAKSYQPSAKSTSAKEQKPLAEKTIEDVLLYFGNTKTVARRRYRQFVKNGIDQGKRPELQGGGLVRSAGGNKSGLLGRKKEERDPPDSPEALDGGRGKGDARILGSGDFVEEILQESNEIYEMKTRNRISLDDLILKVSTNVDLDMEDLKSSKRNRKVSYARAVISYLAVNQLGWNASDVARKLRISGMGVGKCVDRGKKILDKPEIIKEYLGQV